MYVVQTWKAKQGFGYVESDEIRDVTPIRQNCNQIRWKGPNIKSDIFVKVDVFNRRLVGYGVEQWDQAFFHRRLCRCWPAFRFLSSRFPYFLLAALRVLVRPTMHSHSSISCAFCDELCTLDGDNFSFSDWWNMWYRLHQITGTSNFHAQYTPSLV